MPGRARHQGPSGVAGTAQSHGMDCQETWEALYCPPVVTGMGAPESKIPRPGGACLRRPGARKRDTHEQTTGGTGWRINKSKGSDAGSRSALIVPSKAGNRGHRDPLEGSGASCSQTHWWETMEETPSSANTYTKQQWIAKQARKHPDRVFTSLHHLIDIDWMREAYRLTRKDGAAGIDGVRAADYEKALESNLEDLLNRIKSGRYFAPPVRRHDIPKPDGTKRTLGIPTFEDKVAQRATVMLLEPIYEQDFLSCSYGFRPGRSCHDALDALRTGIMERHLRWVIDADISKCFSSIAHCRLREVLDLRIRDGVVRRMIDKWLKAGMLHEGHLKRTDTGTPEGGVISPLISNIFLHMVLDRWFEDAVKPRLKGRSQLVRYADDLVATFECERDARRAMAVLGKRLGRFGLTLHETKTRFVDFRAPRGKGPNLNVNFDFLGFTHTWGTSRKGFKVVRQVTAKARFARAVKSMRVWCKANRHRPLNEQHAHLARVIRGHCAYYGLTGNGKRLLWFHWQVKCSWRKALSRRSRAGPLSWACMDEVLKRHPLPAAKVMRSIYAP